MRTLCHLERRASVPHVRAAACSYVGQRICTTSQLLKPNQHHQHHLGYLSSTAAAAGSLQGSTSRIPAGRRAMQALAAVAPHGSGTHATSTPPASAGQSASLRDAKVVVVSTRACPYCKKAKEALGSAGVAYVEVDVSEAQELRAQVREATGSRTVPQVFVGGRSIGGSDALAAQLADGSFSQLLAKTALPALPPALLEAALQQLQQHEQQAKDSGAAASSAQLQLLERIAQDMAADRSGLPRTELVVGERRVPTFTGTQAVEWLLSQQPQGSSREEALATAQKLLQANLLSACPPAGASWTCPDQKAVADSNEARYFLVSEAPNPVAGQALNTHFCWHGPARPATQVALDLRQRILDLYERHLSADGRAVSYKSVGQDPLFKKYVDASAELQRLDLSPLSPPELTALFINLYNALIVHALVVLGVGSSSVARAKFFASCKYNIGGSEYSADDMENGVLRGNRPAASNLWVLVGLPQFSGGQFSKPDDPRRAKIIQQVDPRIHFALVCGAKSCPPIKLYTPENLDEGLDAAGEAFCASEVIVNRSKRTVTLSKIFKWYAIDFGANQSERLRWISRFLQGAARTDLEAMLGDGGRIAVEYKEYDWSLNTDD